MTKQTKKAKPVCQTCGHTEDNHPYRHLFRPFRPFSHPQDNGWEKRFDEKFVKSFDRVFADYTGPSQHLVDSFETAFLEDMGVLKTFISSEITKARQEERNKIKEWVNNGDSSYVTDLFGTGKTNFVFEEQELLTYLDSLDK